MVKKQPAKHEGKQAEPIVGAGECLLAEIEAEQSLVAANRELIRRMEAKVKAAIDRVWGAS